MTRYKILDELLGRRTIEKDLYYLEYEGPFMVDIERYSVASYNPDKQKAYFKRCLRYAKPSFSIFKREMTDNEVCLLREALLPFSLSPLGCGYLAIFFPFLTYTCLRAGSFTFRPARS